MTKILSNYVCYINNSRLTQLYTLVFVLYSSWLPQCWSLIETLIRTNRYFSSLLDIIASCQRYNNYEQTLTANVTSINMTTSERKIGKRLRLVNSVRNRVQISIEKLLWVFIIFFARNGCFHVLRNKGSLKGHLTMCQVLVSVTNKASLCMACS